jgi:hypothetical protein
MSRSYHITRKAAVVLARSDEPTGVQAWQEKRVVKDTTKRYRAAYPAARPSAKQTKLKNSFTVSTVKRVLERKRERESSDRR